MCEGVRSVRVRKRSITHLFFFHTFECISTTLSSTDTMKVNREDRMEERVTNIEKCCEETYTCADFDSCDDGNVKRPLRRRSSYKPSQSIVKKNVAQLENYVQS